MSAPTNMPAAPAAPSRKRWSRRRRWAVASLVVLVVLAVATFGAVAAYLRTSADPPFALPAGAAAQPAGGLDGEWTVSSGAEAGFRVGQTVLFMNGEVDGRTSDVTGMATFAADRATGASFQVDLTTIKANGKASPQFEQSLDTANYPTATVALAGPVSLGSGFATGTTLTTSVAAKLTLRGRTRDVTASLSARRDGSNIDVAGSIPITFSDWGMPQPTGFGPLGSLADHGSAEFLLVLRHA